LAHAFTEPLQEPLDFLCEDDPAASLPLDVPDEPMRSVLALADSIAGSDVAVLLQGETGVGKEVLARRIHERSHRADGRFVKVHCAALPGSLLENELFGHEPGAFTGAQGSKRGRFELADGGTILLDEIGEIPLELQAKLLQVLEEHRYCRLGSNRETRVDVRVLCATNRSLTDMVEAGTFRRDLFHRIEEIVLCVPPLRERRSEIPGLFMQLLEHHCKRLGRAFVAPSPRLLSFFLLHPFPGNVRELDNFAHRLAVLGNDKSIVEEMIRAAGKGFREPDLTKLIHDLASSAGSVPLLEVKRCVMREAERVVIERALLAMGYNRTRTAGALRVSYSTLLAKIRSCGIELPDRSEE
jgi:two-component system response regulator AtoC